MNRRLLKHYIPAIALFIVLNALFIILAKRFVEWGFNTDVLLLGNLLLFLISAMSFLMGARAMTTKNTHSFLRLVYGSFILKLVILAAAAFIYISIARKDV